MSTLISNIDPRKNPTTSVLGFLMICLAMALYALPLFITLKAPVEWYMPIGLGVIGLSLLLIPDDLKTALARLINKKADQL